MNYGFSGYNSRVMRSGSLRLSHNAWFLVVYVGRKQRFIRLGHRREFMNKREVRQAADRKLMSLEMAGNTARLSLDEFLEHWYLPVADGRLRPSTAAGYRGLWERYVRGQAKKPLWQYRTVDVQHLLNGIAKDNPKLSKATLQHVKAFLSGVFRHSIVAGLRDGNNPVTLALIPRTSAPGKQPGVYTFEEVNRALPVLKFPAKAAVAIAAFAGLRRAEIQGLSWDDYDGEALTVKQTAWRSHVSDPKSAASKNWVPAIPPLRTILDEYRTTFGEPRTIQTEDGPVTDRSMFPVSGRGGQHDSMDLDHMGRNIVAKAFRSKGIEWKGWHAFRRGLASTLFELGCDDLTVQRILRHAKVSVTREHYIKLRDPKLEDAMNRLSTAFEGRTRGG